MSKPKKKISDKEIRALVIERLKTLPSNIKVSIGNEGSFTKENLIAKVREGDTTGRKIIEVELEYLRALKKGDLFNESNTSHHPA